MITGKYKQNGKDNKMVVLVSSNELLLFAPNKLSLSERKKNGKKFEYYPFRHNLYQQRLNY